MHPTVFLGTDHGGFAKKEVLKEALRVAGYVVEDCGAATYEADDDYPKYALVVAQRVVEARKSGVEALGVLFCRSGIGMAIAANKVPGMRAATCFSVEHATHARSNDDVLVLSLPADLLTDTEVADITMAFCQTPFSKEDRHVRRVEQITAFEERKTV